MYMLYICVCRPEVNLECYYYGGAGIPSTWIFYIGCGHFNSVPQTWAAGALPTEASLQTDFMLLNNFKNLTYQSNQLLLL